MIRNTAFYLVIIITVASCGIQMKHPKFTSQSSWRVINYNDSIQFESLNKKEKIDSVKWSGSKSNIEVEDLRWCLSANSLRAGVNELDFVFYTSKGKARKLRAMIYMVSDITPVNIVVDDYTLLPHDKAAFTQGLVINEGKLYESTGLKGKSSLRIIDKHNGNIKQLEQIPDSLFAEGICFNNDDLLLLTWQDGKAFRYTSDLAFLKEYHFSLEGWGITSADGCIISSDGSDELHYLSESFKRDSSFQVFNANGPVNYLNELEYINGYVWANVLGQDKIAVIEMDTGRVMYTIDVSQCIDRIAHPYAGSLNGIAFDKDENCVFITGKNWPFIIVWSLNNFEISI